MLAWRLATTEHTFDEEEAADLRHQCVLVFQSPIGPPDYVSVIEGSGLGCKTRNNILFLRLFSQFSPNNRASTCDWLLVPNLL